MRPPGSGLRYVPREAVNEFPAPPLAKVSEPGSTLPYHALPSPAEPRHPSPRRAVPRRAVSLDSTGWQSSESQMPGASGTTLDSIPQLYPASGTTELYFLYTQLQNAAFPGTANEWSASQVFTVAPSIVLTDTGGGLDTDALRPASLILEHRTSATTVAGVGTSLEMWTKDAAGTRTRIGRDVAEITTTTAAAVDSTRTFCVQKAGEEVEALRIKGATGTAAYTPIGGTTGLSGKAGGEVLIWGCLNHFGNLLGFYGATAATKPTVSGSRGSNAALTSLLSALSTLGLVVDGSS